MSSDNESQVPSPTESESPPSTPLGSPDFPTISLPGIASPKGKQQAPKQVERTRILKVKSPSLLRSHSKPYSRCKSSKPTPSAVKTALQLLRSHCSCEIDETKIADIMSGGLAGISQETFRHAVLAKEASREIKRHLLLATAWEIEETKRYEKFLELLHEERRHDLDSATDEFHFFESLAAERSLPSYHQERKELLTTYDREMKALSLVDKELDGMQSLTAQRGKGRAIAGTLGEPSS
ncbi:hypothetical protein HYDPIDRAFT_168178 [Hydnomerulius pinastri MD-312]|uniref:Uncharacterized protein n=1 Tax=Hydnomerulius pinastri MD-312 TaxID=994086 RepID=A0A0C9VEZ4_9AGAM|nr:hypothetical protein HYDPIDRAFT_168178 [Hydnomerulius pinastri MD-312]